MMQNPDVTSVAGYLILNFSLGRSQRKPTESRFAGSIVS